MLLKKLNNKFEFDSSNKCERTIFVVKKIV